MSRLSDAAGHAAFHAARCGELGEAESVPWVRTPSGDLIADTCDECGDYYGSIIDTPRGWLCPTCANTETPIGGPME